MQESLKGLPTSSNFPEDGHCIGNLDVVRFDVHIVAPSVSDHRSREAFISHLPPTHTIAEIMELLLDTICSKRQYIRIAGDDKPREVVKSQFLKLNSTHIEYVLSSFKENASKVRNIKQYLLASLYNAPLTISNYYDALVRHDMANGFV